MRLTAPRIRRSPNGSMSRASRCRTGEDGSAKRACKASRRNRGRVARGVFPRRRSPRSRRWRASCRPSRAFRSRASRALRLAREAVERGIVARDLGTTVWRWLAEDAIRPWNYRSWIFPRDPNFAEKAGRILDLYEGRWQGELLDPGDFVICADEKPSIQARTRMPPDAPRQRRRRAAGRARVRAQGRALLPRRLGRPSSRIFDRCAAPRTGSNRSTGSSSSS